MMNIALPRKKSSRGSRAWLPTAETVVMPSPSNTAPAVPGLLPPLRSDVTPHSRDPGITPLQSDVMASPAPSPGLPLCDGRRLLRHRAWRPLPEFKPELVVLPRHPNDAALREPAEQQLFGERLLDVLLDDAGERPRPEEVV